MARPLRSEYPGAVYHVMARGNARSPIYLDDADRDMFLNVLGKVVSDLNWLCHAYCKMQDLTPYLTISSSSAFSQYHKALKAWVVKE